MIFSKLSGRALVAAAVTFWPVWAAAECQIYKIPSICDPVAQDSQHWIGEYTGQEASFEMTFDGRPFDPPRQKTGVMTMFEMSGALGFAGGGGFDGTAELTAAERAASDAEVFSGDWSWMLDDEVLSLLQAQHIADTDDPDSCPLRWWPRWNGTYQPPNSPVMNITLIATTFDQMFGRVYYSGQQNGVQVVIDSRFTMSNNGFDPTGYSKETHGDESEMCQAHCAPDARTFLCAD